MSRTDAIVCRRAWVSGRVQGVSFRVFTRMVAEQLRLDGHALNLPDGRVEVLVRGEMEAVDALLRWLHTGPPAARVDTVNVEDAAPADCQPGFRIG